MRGFCNTISKRRSRQPSYNARLTRAATEARKRKFAVQENFTELDIIEKVEIPLQMIILDHRFNSQYVWDMFSRSRRNDSFSLVKGSGFYGNMGFSQALREIGKHTPVNIINYD